MKDIAIEYPHVEFKVVERKQKYPEIRAKYCNGNEKVTDVRRMDAKSIKQELIYLLNHDGQKDQKYYKNVMEVKDDSVVWDPFTCDIGFKV